MDDEHEEERAAFEAVVGRKLASMIADFEKLIHETSRASRFSGWMKMEDVLRISAAAEALASHVDESRRSKYLQVAKLGEQIIAGDASGQDEFRRLLWELRPEG